MRWIISGLVATIVIAAGVWFLFNRDPVTQAHFEAIKVGMTEPELVALVGPPGDYRPHGGGAYFYSGPGVVPLPPAGSKIPFKIWIGEKHAYRIIFDADGRVASKQIYEVPKQLRWHGR